MAKKTQIKFPLAGKRIADARVVYGYTERHQLADIKGWPSDRIIGDWERKGIPENRLHLLFKTFNVEEKYFLDETISDETFKSYVRERKVNPKALLEKEKLGEEQIIEKFLNNLNNTITHQLDEIKKSVSEKNVSPQQVKEGTDYYDLVLLILKENKIDEAISNLEKLIDSHPYNHKAYYLLALVLVVEKSNIDKANIYLNKLDNYYGELYETNIVRGVIEIIYGTPSKASKFLIKSSKLTDDIVLKNIYLSISFLMVGDIKSAGYYIEESCKFESKHPLADYLRSLILGFIELCKFNIDKALSHFEKFVSSKAIEEDKGSLFISYLIIGIINLLKGNLNKTLECLYKVEDITNYILEHTEDDIKGLNNLLSIRIIIMLFSENSSKLEEEFSNPNEVTPLSLFAEGLMKLITSGDLSGCKQDFSKAMNIDQSFFIPNLILGINYMVEETWDEALTCIREFDRVNRQLVLDLKIFPFVKQSFFTEENILIQYLEEKIKIKEEQKYPYAFKSEIGLLKIYKENAVEKIEQFINKYHNNIEKTGNITLGNICKRA